MRPRQSDFRDSAPHELPLCYCFICKAPTKVTVRSECTLSPQVFPGLSTSRPDNALLDATLNSEVAGLHAPASTSLITASGRRPATPRMVPFGCQPPPQYPWNANKCCILSALALMGGLWCKVKMQGFFCTRNSDFTSATTEP